VTARDGVAPEARVRRVVDARARRTDIALREAVVALATEASISSVTVGQLTLLAQINRSTFYSHYRSPLELLLAVLGDDLNQIRERGQRWHAVRGGESTALQLGLDDVVGHVSRFRAIYQRSLRNGSDPAVFRSLVDHFAETFSLFIDAKVIVVRDGVDVEVLARFVAHGISGAIEVWLEDAGVSREKLIQSLTAIESALWR
jgi:AcrR family transcriptional regulator